MTDKELLEKVAGKFIVLCQDCLHGHFLNNDCPHFDEDICMWQRELAEEVIPPIQKAERERITDLMFENGFSTLVYFHPGEGHRDWADRWVAGILTGRDNDLICVKHCKTVEEGERWLSPGASDPLTAIESAIALKGETNEKPTD